MHSERQQREIDYHRAHAQRIDVTQDDLDWSVLDAGCSRSWNAYWHLWERLRADVSLAGSRVLVIGCGAGNDALLFARLGSRVSAFDISPDMLALAAANAEKAGLQIDFSVSAAESVPYPEQSFDVIFVRDVLHHVDIEPTMRELQRVAAPGCRLIMSEIYSHSSLQRIRDSGPVSRLVYPAVRRIIYGRAEPYITEDERKLTEGDIRTIRSFLSGIERTDYFYVVVKRFIAEGRAWVGHVDRALLRLTGSAGSVLAGRIIMFGRMKASS